jgi:hypothetical protein
MTQMRYGALYLLSIMKRKLDGHASNKVGQRFTALESAAADTGECAPTMTARTEMATAEVLTTRIGLNVE